MGDRRVTLNTSFASDRDANRYRHASLTSVSESTNANFSRRITTDGERTLLAELTRLEDLEISAAYVSFARPLRFVSRDIDALRYAFPKIVTHTLNHLKICREEKNVGAFSAILSCLRSLVREVGAEAFSAELLQSVMDECSVFPVDELNMVEACYGTLHEIGACLRTAKNRSLLYPVFLRTLVHQCCHTNERIRGVFARSLASFLVHVDDSILSALVNEVRNFKSEVELAEMDDTQQPSHDLEDVDEMSGEEVESEVQPRPAKRRRLTDSETVAPKKTVDISASFALWIGNAMTSVNGHLHSKGLRLLTRLLEHSHSLIDMGVLGDTLASLISDTKTMIELVKFCLSQDILVPVLESLFKRAAFQRTCGSVLSSELLVDSCSLALVNSVFVALDEEFVRRFVMLSASRGSENAELEDFISKRCCHDRVLATMLCRDPVMFVNFHKCFSVATGLDVDVSIDWSVSSQVLFLKSLTHSRHATFVPQILSTIENYAKHYDDRHADVCSAALQALLNGSTNVLVAEPTLEAVLLLLNSPHPQVLSAMCSLVPLTKFASKPMDSSLIHDVQSNAIRRLSSELVAERVAGIDVLDTFRPQSISADVLERIRLLVSDVSDPLHDLRIRPVAIEAIAAQAGSDDDVSERRLAVMHALIGAMYVPLKIHKYLAGGLSGVLRERDLPLFMEVLDREVHRDVFGAGRPNDAVVEALFSTLERCPQIAFKGKRLLISWFNECHAAQRLQMFVSLFKQFPFLDPLPRFFDLMTIPQPSLQLLTLDCITHSHKRLLEPASVAKLRELIESPREVLSTWKVGTEHSTSALSADIAKSGKSSELLLQVVGGICWSIFKVAVKRRLKKQLFTFYSQFGSEVLSKLLVDRLLEVRTASQVRGMVESLHSLLVSDVRCSQFDYRRMYDTLWSHAADNNAKGAFSCLALLCSLVENPDILDMAAVLRQLGGLPVPIPPDADDFADAKAPTIASQEIPEIVEYLCALAEVNVSAVPDVTVFRILSLIATSHRFFSSAASERIVKLIVLLMNSLPEDRRLHCSVTALDYLTHPWCSLKAYLDLVLSLARVASSLPSQKCQSLCHLLIKIGLDDSRSREALLAVCEGSEQVARYVVEHFTPSILKLLRTLYVKEARIRTIRVLSAFIPSSSLLIKMHDTVSFDVRSIMDASSIPSTFCDPFLAAHCEFCFSSFCEETPDGEPGMYAMSSGFALHELRTILQMHLPMIVNHSEDEMLLMAKRLAKNDTIEACRWVLVHACPTLAPLSQVNAGNRVDALLRMSVGTVSDDVRIRELFLVLVLRLCEDASKETQISAMRTHAETQRILVMFPTHAIVKQMMRYLAQIVKHPDRSVRCVLLLMDHCGLASDDVEGSSRSSVILGKLKSLLPKFPVLYIPLAHHMKSDVDVTYFYGTLAVRLKNRVPKDRETARALLAECYKIIGHPVTLLQSLEKVLKHGGYTGHVRSHAIFTFVHSYGLLSASDNVELIFDILLRTVCKDLFDPLMSAERGKLLDVPEAKEDFAMKTLGELVANAREVSMIEKVVDALCEAANSIDGLRSALAVVSRSLVAVCKKGQERSDLVREALVYLYALLYQASDVDRKDKHKKSAIGDAEADDPYSAYIVPPEPTRAILSSTPVRLVVEQRTEIIIDFGIASLDFIVRSVSVNNDCLQPFVPLLVAHHSGRADAVSTLAHLLEKQVPLSEPLVKRVTRMFMQRDAMQPLSALVRYYGVAIDDRLVRLVILHFPSQAALGLYLALVFRKTPHAGLYRVLEQCIEMAIRGNAPRDVEKQVFRCLHHALLDLPLPKGKFEAAVAMLSTAVDDHNLSLLDILVDVLQRTPVERIPLDAVFASAIRLISIRVAGNSASTGLYDHRVVELFKVAAKSPYLHEWMAALLQNPDTRVTAIGAFACLPEFSNDSWAIVERAIVDSFRRFGMARDDDGEGSTSEDDPNLDEADVPGGYLDTHQRYDFSSDAPDNLVLVQTTRTVLSCLDRLLTCGTANIKSKVLMSRDVMRNLVLGSLLISRYANVSEAILLPLLQRVIGFALSALTPSSNHWILELKDSWSRIMQHIVERTNGLSQCHAQAVKNVVAFLRLSITQQVDPLQFFLFADRMVRRPSTSHVRRISLLQIYGAAVALYDPASSTLTSILQETLPGVYMCAHEKQASEVGQETITLAAELEDMVKEKIGTQRFVALYTASRKRVEDKKKDRKRVLAEMSVRDPSKYAAFKVAKNRKKSDVKRRKVHKHRD